MKNIFFLSPLFFSIFLNATIEIITERGLSFGTNSPSNIQNIKIPKLCINADNKSNIAKIRFQHDYYEKYALVTVNWTIPDKLVNEYGEEVSFKKQIGWCDDSTNGNVEFITDWKEGKYKGHGIDKKFHNLYIGGEIFSKNKTLRGNYSGIINISISY